MNYIRHLHAFYHHIKRDDRLSTAHISLYMAIFQFWNYHRFQNPFRVNREELMQLSKIGSKNTYHKCTKELHNYRYIIYHTAITKYQPVKVSMIRLDLKVEEKDFLQLDLFNTNDILPAEKANENKQKNSAEKSPQKDGYTSIENGTHTCTEFDTQQCPKNATAHVPFLTASCPKNDTVPVPVLGHYIKHKQINSKHVCVNNTPTQIFLRNKNLGNAVAKLAELNTGGTNEKNTITRAPNSVHATNQIALPEIEIYFQENNFPIQEAQKFFYYNRAGDGCCQKIFLFRTGRHLLKNGCSITQTQKRINMSKPIPNKNIFIPDQVKTIQSPFDYPGVWSFLQNKGVELYGRHFRFYPEDTEIILKLITWFLQDEQTALKSGIDLSKGIMLVGPVGCGKSSLMHLCRFLLAADKRHSIKSCRDVTFEFIKEGYEIFHRYTKGSFSQHSFEARVYCFDDLGLENIMNYYGNQCSVMAEILLSRYDLFHAFSMITHLTTNLNSQEIESLYGLRVRSRCREMFNLVAFDKNALDKRK